METEQRSLGRPSSLVRLIAPGHGRYIGLVLRGLLTDSMVQVAGREDERMGGGSA